MTNIYFRTFGCTLNQSDSEVMKGLLDKKFKIVDDIAKADVVIFNTCTVKDPSEKRFFSELKKVLALNKKVVVAGCIAQADWTDERLQQYSLVGVKQLDKIVEVVEETLQGNVVHFIKEEKNQRLNLPKIRRNGLVEIIPLCIGCLGECAYCKTRFARGSLRSYDKEEIKRQFSHAVQEGVKEIWLTSQDNGAYGQDIGPNLPELLKELLKTKGDYWVRLGMINPNFVLKYLDELIEIFKHKNMFKFLHIPLQSGGDRILKAMNRKYTREEFLTVVEKIKKAIPDITLATDVIVGFPGETKEDFNNTVSLLQLIDFDVMNISKFYPRKGTAAARMKLIPTKTIKERSKKITELFDKHSNDKWLGKTTKVYIDNPGKPHTFLGRNEFYKMVVVKGKGLLGKFIDVNITEATRDYIKGELVNR